MRLLNILAESEMTLSSSLLAIILAVMLAVLLSSHAASAEEEMNPHLARGIRDFRAENLEEAIDSLILARQTVPKSSLAAYYLGIAYKAAGKHKSAVLHLEDSLMLSPRVREAAFELGETYYQLGRYDDALTKLSLSSELGVNRSSATFLSGLALSALGRTELAVEAFENAKELDPGLTQSADIQIAIALMKAKKKEEAERILKQVVVTDPNSELGRFAEDYLESIKKREAAARPLKLAVHLDYAYDDNVISRPLDEAAAAGATGESDEKFAVNLSADYNINLGARSAMKLNYSLYYLQHMQLASYDVVSHTASLVPSLFSEGGHGLYKVPIVYNHTWVDDIEYMSTSSVAPDYTFSPIEGHIATLGVEYKIKDLIQAPTSNEEDRDAVAWGATASWSILFAENRGLAGLAYKFTTEDADGVNWSNTGHKGTLTLTSPMTEKMAIRATGEAFYQRYKNVHTSLLVKREESTYTLGAVLSYAYGDYINFRPHYTYTRADSNIAVYDYEKNVYGIAIDGRF